MMNIKRAVAAMLIVLMLSAPMNVLCEGTDNVESESAPRAAEAEAPKAEEKVEAQPEPPRPRKSPKPPLKLLL